MAVIIEENKEITTENRFISSLSIYIFKQCLDMTLKLKMHADLNLEPYSLH